MSQIFTVQVGADGVLRLPLGTKNANKTVQLTVEVIDSDSPRRPTTREEWLQFIEKTAGRWEGELERPPQGEYEERDPL